MILKELNQEAPAAEKPGKQHTPSSTPTTPGTYLTTTLILHHNHVSLKFFPTTLQRLGEQEPFLFAFTSKPNTGYSVKIC